MTTREPMPSAGEMLEAIAADLRSKYEELDARRHAGTKDGISSDDFLGAAYEDGIRAGLTVAMDRVEEALSVLRAMLDETNANPGRTYGPEEPPLS